MFDFKELIDLKPIADVANNLIEKLAKAIGWVATRDNLNKEAIKVYVDEIKNSNDPPLLKAAKISSAKKSIKEYINQYNIISISSQSINCDNRAQYVDNDWLDQFMEMAKMISDEEFRIIWGKVLAEECNKPGSISKSVLFTLQKMDKEDALFFTKLSGLVVQIGQNNENAPFVTDISFDSSKPESCFYSKVGLTFDGLAQLDALGLVKMDIGHFKNGFSITIDKSERPVIVRYFDESLTIEQLIDQIPIGLVMLTKDGQSLYNAINPSKVEGFWEQIVLPSIKKGIKNDDVKGL